MASNTVNARLRATKENAPDSLPMTTEEHEADTMTRELQNTVLAWQGNDGDSCQNWVSKGSEPVDHCKNCKAGKGSMWNEGQDEFRWRCGTQPVNNLVEPASANDRQCNGQGTFVPEDLLDLCCDGATCNYNGFCRCA